MSIFEHKKRFSFGKSKLPRKAKKRHVKEHGRDMYLAHKKNGVFNVLLRKFKREVRSYNHRAFAEETKPIVTTKMLVEKASVMYYGRIDLPISAGPIIHAI